MLADFVILRVEYMLWILISHNSFGLKENNVKAGEIHISSLRNRKICNCQIHIKLRKCKNVNSSKFQEYRNRTFDDII